MRRWLGDLRLKELTCSLREHGKHRHDYAEHMVKAMNATAFVVIAKLLAVIVKQLVDLALTLDAICRGQQPFGELH